MHECRIEPETVLKLAEIGLRSTIYMHKALRNGSKIPPESLGKIFWNIFLKHFLCKGRLQSILPHSSRSPNPVEIATWSSGPQEQVELNPPEIHSPLEGKFTVQVLHPSLEEK